MSLDHSYHDRTFRVTDPDARVRAPKNLLKFAPVQPGEDYRRIPLGAEVRVSEVAVLPMGSDAVRVFGLATSLDGATRYGWTSTRNFEDSFRNVTLGRIEPAVGAGRFAPTATWEAGDYRGQAPLLSVLDRGLRLKRLTEPLAERWLGMVDAASADGVTLHLSSGFRSYGQQKRLFDGWKRQLPGFHLAARPGHSNHQSGLAIDISVGGGSGNPPYDWLAANATAHGLVRTVRSEVWHWEFLPERARQARGRGSHKTWDLD